ncbi:NADPH-dependent assimilatory sulfite reductase hemoprotein subunit [Candidatus Laterigemmans baculatus]|uniref:NADPH-dependent assimilatory sulfite reductase hemoprotein subunit n=1 Tax=Candidatus Laterigemmans baculatus TaxID=2770505 RepID=UPI0013D93ED7|nr:NADPH-dependent assimilatory sulfite reductase hemoprotein subunit [Candidatus Laterigemmans baculatus]
MSTDTPQSPDTQKLTAFEKLKEDSRYLRGTIAEELKEPTDHFDKDNIQLLKFHGMYQQDDRDLRGAARKEGGGKAFGMMLRSRIPGGRMTSEQFLAELDLCDEFGNATMKITTRQSIQLHGIAKGNLKQTIKRINDVQLSTLAACGDVNRNVMCCPAKRADGLHQEIQDLSQDLAMSLAPQTTGYYELWMTDPETDEKTLVGGQPEGSVVEPLYGPRYLPRKFKCAVTLADDNCVDIYANDLGFLAVVRDGKIIGYNVLVGGSMGVTPSAAKTFPALAKRMAFVTPDQVIDVAKAVIMVQRDYGNREDRKRARMKYLIHDWGIERFRAMVEEYFGSPLQDCTPDDVSGFDDHMGWQEQGDGLWSYGLNIENGRLYDNEHRQLKEAMREICGKLNPNVRLTAHQSVIFCDLQESDRAVLEEICRRHRVPLTEETSTVRRWSMACVALPTCGLAITESERILPSIIDSIEQPLAKLGLDRDAFTIRMTGCPNGCARPYNSDIALVGKAKGKYTLFAGGALLGTRLAYIYKDMVPEESVTEELIGIFAAYKANREQGESLGDFCHRVGRDALETLAAEAPKP